MQEERVARLRAIGKPVQALVLSACVTPHPPHLQDVGPGGLPPPRFLQQQKQRVTREGVPGHQQLLNCLGVVHAAAQQLGRALVAGNESAVSQQ